MLAVPAADVYAAAARLSISANDRAVFALTAHAAAWEVVPDAAGIYTYASESGHTYTVTADTCECPAYTKPIEAGDPPRLCYHRKAVHILTVLLDDQDRARREAELAAYRATMDAGVLPADLGAGIPAIPVAPAPEVMEAAAWEEFQARKGMLILPEVRGRGRRRTG